jgi:predicted transcriptional regulator
MKDRGTCITAAMKKDREFEKEIDYHRYWKDMYEKEHKLRQEAEGEMTIVKGIGQNSPEMKAAKAKIEELNGILDRVKLDNNNLYTRVADSLEVNEHHQELNGKLQSRITEVEEDNRKLANQIEDKVNQMRRSGM